MNTLIGSVQFRASGAGIPHLLVTAYDTYSRSMPSPPVGTLAGGDDASHWNRLGSAITSDQGAFRLTYNVDGQNGNCTQRPDLVLILSASEESCTPCQEPRSRIATCVRHNAASVENFIIVLDEAQLAAAGIPIPREHEDIEELIKQRHRDAQRQERLRAESQRLFMEKLQKRREFERLAEAKFDTFLSMLSALPTEQRHLLGGRYVPHGASVQAANQAIMQAGIQGRINQATVVGVAALSDAHAAQFRDANGQFIPAIRAAELELFLRPKPIGRGPVLTRRTPPALLCNDGPVDPCVKILRGEEPHDDNHDRETGPPPAPSPRKHGIPLLIETLVKDMTSPESASIFQAQSRAKIGDVRESVQGFSLESGPADAPSFHDFHQLQIAFEHVWQELFDKDMVDKAKSLYTDLVELGVDPNEYLIDQSENGYLISQSLVDAISPPVDPPATEPYGYVISQFDITPRQWQALYPDQREALVGLAYTIFEREFQKEDMYRRLADFQSHPGAYDMPIEDALADRWFKTFDQQIRNARRMGESIIRYAGHKLQSAQDFNQFHHLLKDLAKAMKQPYRFSIYAANRRERSVNFGVVATYRQKWEPVSYQVGELVKTIPLAPKEVRRFTKKVAIRKSRAEKEVENHLHARKTESTETARAETEIVQKAQKKTNFQLSAEGGMNIGIANASGKTAFAQDAATDSQETKKEFREAVFKAAEEYKSERTVEINVSTAEEFNFEESGEISNPNDEIPVTYLFYELQRRFRVSEQIHRLTPIVLVAQEFPEPSEIDEDWIIAHDWILRRVILDDSFVPAMNYVTSKVVGDEFALQEMYQNVQQQRRIAEGLKEELVVMRAQAESRYGALQQSIQERAAAIQADEEGGGFTLLPVPVPVVPSLGGEDITPEAAQVREDAAKDAYERAVKQEKELLGRLERETTALNTLTETYTKNLSDHLNRKEQIARLRVHLKANIMYYMQAIWSHESHDQRFFRLHEVLVPKLQGTTTYTLEIDPDAVPMQPDWKQPYKVVAHCALDPKFEYITLGEAADLDNLLGFKGNYMMFPLKKSNPLTDFMMIPYLDPVFGLRDPDPLGNWTLTEFVKYVCCLREQLSKAEFEKLLPGLMETYRLLVNAPGTDGEEIIVPTNSLFIEALPGVHPILEDFKLFHRVVDVKKVQAEVRGVEFENLRFAARLMEGEREDPTIDTKVVVEGGTSVIVQGEDI